MRIISPVSNGIAGNPAKSTAIADPADVKSAAGNPSNVHAGNHALDSARLTRLAQLRSMPWEHLVSIIGSGKYGPLERQVYMARLQNHQEGAQRVRDAAQNKPSPPGSVVPDNPAHSDQGTLGVVQKDGSVKPMGVTPVAGARHLPSHGTPPNDPHGTSHAQVQTPAVSSNTGLGGGFTGLLAGLLGKSNTGQMIPTSLASRAAGPDNAAVTALQNEIAQEPSAKAQALANIANWYGQVAGSEKTAATRDQSIANAGSSAMQDAAKGIMASLGGSAMAGSGAIGAMGANDAATMQAIGANDASLSADLQPIFNLAEAGAKGTTQQQFQQGDLQLQDALAQATGQGQADKANALMQILGANNQTRQSNFSNKAGLLNTLAGLEISGMANAAKMPYYQSQTIKNLAEAKHYASANSGGKYDFANSTPDTKQKALQEIVSTISTGGKLNNGMAWPHALQLARNIVRGYGWNPMNPQVARNVVGPALSSVGITGAGPNGFWPAVFQP